MKNTYGDVLLGKTFTQDPISKRRIINRGEEDQYYISNHHTPIISKETFNLAQEVLAQRSKCREENRIRGNYSRVYTFSSKLCCGYCGGFLTRRNINSGKLSSNRTWQCTTSVKKGKVYCEKSKLIKEDVLENVFVDTYNLLLKNEKSILNKFVQRVEGYGIISENEKQLKKINRTIDTTKQKMNNLLNLLTEGVIAKEQFVEKNTELDKYLEKQEQLRDKLLMEKNNNEILNRGITKIQDLFSNNIILEKFDPDLFETVVKYVIIGKDDDPYMIRFVLKNGDGFTKNEEEITEKLTILEYRSNQRFFAFEKNEQNHTCKILKQGLNVSVEIEY